MASKHVCDGCGKDISEDNPQVLKLFATPVNGHKTSKEMSKYNSHMDIGKCCLVRTNNFGKWQKRKARTKKREVAKV